MRLPQSLQSGSIFSVPGERDVDDCVFLIGIHAEFLKNLTLLSLECLTKLRAGFQSTSGAV